MSKKREFSIETSKNCLIRKTGADRPETIIFLAGYADNGTMFLPLFQSSLTDQYNLITIDLPGTGGSPASSKVSTIRHYAEHIASIIKEQKIDYPGIVGHSIASAIGVEISNRTTLSGFFSIEGNLTEQDAYFTGRAAKYDSYEEFWTAQRMEAKAAGIDNQILSRYYAAATFADPETTWLLGKDAVKQSKDNSLGHKYLQASCPTHYFWSKDNTPEETQSFIKAHNIPNSTYSGSHWPTLDRTAETARAIESFFDQCFRDFRPERPTSPWAGSA